MKVIYSSIAACALMAVPALADGYNWSGVYLGLADS